MIDPELLARLRDQPWEEIILELDRYALRKARRKFWPTGSSRGATQRTLIGGWTVTDVSHEAIRRVFDGDRTWDPGKDPDLVKYLKGVIDSILSSLVESSENRNVRHKTPYGKAGDLADEETVDGVEMESGGLHKGFDSPATVAAMHDNLSLILDLLDGDEPLQLLVLALADGQTKREDIAQTLGVTPSEVTNMRKRLRARMYETPTGDIEPRSAAR